MAHPHLFEGIRFGPQQYDLVLDDPLLVVSYEIEFVWPIVETTTVPDWNRTQQTLLKQLKTIGLDTSSSAGAKSRWRLVGDRSIETDNNGFGFELIAPLMDIQSALKNLQLVFDWMKANNCITNNSTGLHINISRGGIKATRAIDPLKVVLLTGEKFILQMFQREANTFARPHKQELVNEIAASLRRTSRDWLRNLSIKELIDRVRDDLNVSKYKTVNLGKLKLFRNSYFEFRMMGNTNYQLRFDEIKRTILRYGFLLQIGSDPQAYRREYLQELAKILIQALSETVPQRLERDPSTTGPMTTRSPELSTPVDPIVRWATAPRNFAQAAIRRVEGIKNQLADPDDYWQKNGKEQLSKYIIDLPDDDSKNAHAAALAIKIMLLKAGLTVDSFISDLRKTLSPSAIKHIKSYLSKAQS